MESQCLPPCGQRLFIKSLGCQPKPDISPSNKVEWGYYLRKAKFHFIENGFSFRFEPHQCQYRLEIEPMTQSIGNIPKPLWSRKTLQY